MQMHKSVGKLCSSGLWCWIGQRQTARLSVLFLYSHVRCLCVRACVGGVRYTVFFSAMNSIRQTLFFFFGTHMHAHDRHLSFTVRARRFLTQPYGGGFIAFPHTHGSAEIGGETKGRRAQPERRSVRIPLLSWLPEGRVKRRHVRDQLPGEEQHPPSDGKRPGLVIGVGLGISPRACKSLLPMPAERGLKS